MIVDERFASFVKSFEKGNSGFLGEVEEQALALGIPMIRPEAQSLLKVLLALQKPQAILEVGTGTGFSALLMKAHAPEGCKITTIEKDARRVAIAEENFGKSGQGEEIDLLAGDAALLLRELEGPFDFIFLDGAKGQYVHFLPEAVRLLRQGGILLSDNVLKDGEIIQSRYGVTRRNRTIHSRMRAYLHQIKNHAQLETAILTVGDGMALSVKR